MQHIHSRRMQRESCMRLVRNMPAWPMTSCCGSKRLLWSAAGSFYCLRRTAQTWPELQVCCCSFHPRMPNLESACACNIPCRAMCTVARHGPATGGSLGQACCTTDVGSWCQLHASGEEAVLAQEPQLWQLVRLLGSLCTLQYITPARTQTCCNAAACMRRGAQAEVSQRACLGATCLPCSCLRIFLWCNERSNQARALLQAGVMHQPVSPLTACRQLCRRLPACGEKAVRLVHDPSLHQHPTQFGPSHIIPKRTARQCWVSLTCSKAKVCMQIPALSACLQSSVLQQVRMLPQPGAMSRADIACSRYRQLTPAACMR